jgi:hypothetical protein
VKVIATDGAGSGAAVVDTLDGLEGSLSSLTVTGSATIDGGATDNTVLTLDSGTANTFLKITDSNSTNGAFIGATTNDLNFYPNNSLAVTMTAAGNVGIGIANPSAYAAKNLVIAATDEEGITIVSDPAHQGYLMFADGTSGSQKYRGYLGYDHNIDNLNVISSGTMKFYSGDPATERMRLDSSGRLMVGLTSNIGGARLNIAHPTDCIGVNLGPSASGERYFMYFTYNGTNVGSIRGNASSTSFNTSSDQRLKENIADASSASEDIDAIQVRSFDWKVDGSHQDYGMIAQELQAVAPEAVSGDADSEEMMGVDYSKLVPMMLKEIQSLRARINALETE